MSTELVTRIGEAASASTYGGSGVALFGAYSANDVAAVVGAVCAVLGLVVGTVFRYISYRHLVGRAGQGDNNV
ncbi:MAG: holin [Bermanella sp.]